MAVNQVCFVHVLANLTQKALIWLPPNTVKVSVIFYKSEKSKLNVIQITHLQRQSMKNLMKKKCIAKDKERKVWQLLLVGEEHLQRKTVPTEQTDYLQWRLRSNTP